MVCDCRCCTRSNRFGAAASVLLPVVEIMLGVTVAPAAVVAPGAVLAPVAAITLGDAVTPTAVVTPAVLVSPAAGDSLVGRCYTLARKVAPSQTSLLAWAMNPRRRLVRL